MAWKEGPGSRAAPGLQVSRKLAWGEGHVIPGTSQDHGKEERRFVLIDRVAALIHLLGNSCAGHRALAWATPVTDILLVCSIHSQLLRTVSSACLSGCWCPFFILLHSGPLCSLLLARCALQYPVP